MQREPITREEARDWMENPVTINFFNTVNNFREDAIVRLGHGMTARSPGLQNQIVGAINAYTQILGTRFEEDENGGTRTPQA